MKKINFYSENTTDLVALISMMNNIIRMGFYDRLDYMLQSADVNYSYVVLVTLLRSNNSVKNILPHWKILRDRVRDELISRGDDPTSILRGLF